MYRPYLLKSFITCLIELLDDGFEVVTFMFAIVLIIIVIAFPFYVFVNYKKYRYAKNTGLSKFEKLTLISIVENRIPYVKHLRGLAKEKFIKRLLHIAEEFEFIGKEGQIINYEIKTLVSAAICQVTFGLEKYTLSEFSQIYIYPNAFKLNSKFPYTKGLTLSAKTIMFSWRYLKHGFLTTKDGINLGFHEIAHAVMLNYFQKSKIYYPRFKAWTVEAVKIYTKLDDLPPNKQIFRDRAGDNMDEFFAVCIENFFERPELFANTFPDLYGRTCMLLAQNPLNKKNNYKLPG